MKTARKREIFKGYSYFEQSWYCNCLNSFPSYLVVAEFSLVEKHSKPTAEKLQTELYETSLMSLRFANSSISLESTCGTNEF